jgi:hypothetical protein
MSHLMTNGEPCGRKDNHPGSHRSRKGIERDRLRHAKWISGYRMTAAGMLADVNHNARQRKVKL